MGPGITNSSRGNPVGFWENALKNHSGMTQTGAIEDIVETYPELISEIIKKDTTPHREKMNKFLWEQQIAPEEIIKADYAKLLRTDKLKLVSPESANSFIKRAIPGHAQVGDGKFEGYAYPNTELKDIIPITGESLNSFQDRSQKMVDNIVYFAEDWFNRATKNASSINESSKIVMLQNEKGVPINGLEFLAGTPVDILEWARGFYFGSLMDNFSEIRQAGFEKYGHQTGGGECYLVNTPQLKKFGIGLRNLATMDYQGVFNILNDISPKSRLKVLENLGIVENKQLSLDEILKGDFSWNAIKDDAGATDLEKNLNNMGCYIRDERGRGVGDDIAVFLSTFLPQTYTIPSYVESAQAHQSRFLGTLMADQIDTVEKGARIFMPGGQDEVAGQYINRLFRKACENNAFRERFKISKRKDGDYTLIDKDTIVDFTMASANVKGGNLHSSQRWFYKEVKNTCAITEYMKHAYLSAESQGKRIYFSDLSSFDINTRKETAKVKFTYREIPLVKIKNIFEKRLELIINPNGREERIARYFEKTNNF